MYKFFAVVSERECVRDSVFLVVRLWEVREKNGYVRVQKLNMKMSAKEARAKSYTGRLYTPVKAAQKAKPM